MLENDLPEPCAIDRQGYQQIEVLTFWFTVHRPVIMLLPHECSKLMEPLHQDWVEELLLSWICQQLQDYQQQYLHPGMTIGLC